MKNIKLLLLILFVLNRIITLAQPTITAFTPTNGPIGTTVTINGTNFNVTPANNIVFFGATMATVTSASSSSLTVTVPIGATYHNISVTDLTTGLTAYSAHPFVTTFDCGTIDLTSFAPKTDYNAGIGPWGVAIGDFDGDGKSDIAVADQGSDTVLVFRNISTSGAISFAPKVGFNTGAKPSGVSIGDLNGDGKPDIAVANGFSTTISIFKNTCISGIISFEPKVDFTVGGSPWNISIGDLDSDGKPDLAVANDNSATVSILKNTSTGGMISFAIKVDYASGVEPGVTMGDLDGDGRPDLAVVNFGSNSFSVFKNTSTIGSISFAPKDDYSTGIGPNDISIVDFDGDGKLDIAVLNKQSDTISIFRNTSLVGIISFAPKVDYTTGNGSNFFDIGDLDGDGKPDLAVVDASFVSVFRNICSIGTILFAAKVDYDIENGDSHVAIGDIDGDGKPDLVVSSHTTNKFSVLRNTVAYTLVTPSISITASTTNICVGNLVTFTATPTNGGSSPAYQWKLNGLNVGINSPVYSNGTLINNDVISCEMTSSTTCTTTPTVTSNLLNINVYPLPIVNAGNDVTICGGSTTLTASGSGPVTYIWDNGLGIGSSHSVSPINTTTYSVTATSVNGCTNSDQVTVSVSTGLSPAITGSTTFCTGGSTTLDAGIYSIYLWSTGANTQTINATTTGTYSVTVTNASSCTGIDSIIVTESSFLSPTISGNNFCYGGNTVLNAGTGFNTYLWNTGATTQTINVSVPSTYTVTVSDATGCSGTGQISIYEMPIPNVNAGSDVTICLGDSTVLMAMGASSYVWSPATGLSSTYGQFVTATPLSNMIYYVTGTSTDGCTNSDNVVVNIIPSLHPTITGSTTICNGGSIMLNAGSSYSSYLWSNSSTSPVISINTVGIYSVTVTNSSGCTGVDSITITTSTSLTPILTGNNLCTGGSTTLDAGSGYLTYLWSSSGNTQTINVNIAGTYFVTVSNNTGCTGIGQITISEYPLPSVSAGNNVTICNGNSTTLTASGATSYVWSPPNWLSSTTGNPVTATPLSTTIYHVTGTDVNGCSNSDNVVVSVSSAITPTITAGSTSLCFGEYTTLDAGSGYMSYQWSTGASSRTINVNMTGTYSVTVSVALGCSGTDDIAITVNPKPFASFNFQNTCQGQNSFFTNTSNVNSIDFFLWEFGDGSASTEPSPIHIYENSGNYNVYLVAFSQNGCRDTSDIMNISIIPAPFVTIVASDTIIYGNGQIQLTANGNGNIQWFNGASNPTININYPGTFWVTANQNGCQATDSINIYQTNNNDNSGSNIIIESNIVTPNGDGINDYFTISNLQNFQCCNIEIYNMWNEKVYECTNRCYQNEWDGNNTKNNKCLPDGAYYYVVQCGGSVKKGNINLLTKDSKYKY